MPNRVRVRLIAPLLGLLLRSQGVQSAPPPFPGVEIARSTEDFQANSAIGHLVARNPGADVVHFVWMKYCDVPGFQYCDIERNAQWAGYRISSGTVLPAFGGVPISLNPTQARAGYANVAVGEGNLAHVSFHQRSDDAQPYHPWHTYFPVEGNALHVDDDLIGWTSGCPSVLFTKLAVTPFPSNYDVVHEIAIDDVNNCGRGLIWYWRFDGATWQGPVVIDSAQNTAHVIAVDPSGAKVAMAFAPDVVPTMNVIWGIAFHESQTAGVGWLNGTELGPGSHHLITSYGDLSGPQAWPDIAVAYDRSGTLHIVWIEQRVANISLEASLKHWSSATAGISTITVGDWLTDASPGVFNLNFAKVSIGIGDGSTGCQGGSETNANYLYVTYSQFGGPTATERADYSTGGYLNGEIYLTTSRDAGVSWSVPQNLTNTKTPGCDPGLAEGPYGEPNNPDGVCRSEAWPSIGLAVSDIDIFYVGDVDAGSTPQGEGSWQLNPMMYLRLPGGMTDAQYICPTLSSRMGVEYGGSPNSCGLVSLDGAVRDTMTQTINNSGNRVLTGSIAVIYDLPPLAPTQWLRINDSAQTIPFSIAPGAPGLNLNYVCDPTGVAPGIYTASIAITHDDPNQTSPILTSATFTVRACMCHNDPICDGAVDVLDVVKTIGAAFRGDPIVVDETCPATAADVDCSSAVDVLDVVHMVNVAFRGQDAATEFCHPCQ